MTASANTIQNDLSMYLMRSNDEIYLNNNLKQPLASTTSMSYTSARQSLQMVPGATMNPVKGFQSTLSSTVSTSTTGSHSTSISGSSKKSVDRSPLRSPIGSIITTINADRDNFIRVKEEHPILQKLKAMQSAAIDGHVQPTLPAEMRDIFDLLTNLQETNYQNEGTIQYYRQQIVELKNECNSYHECTKRLTRSITKERSEWKVKLRRDRKKFANLWKQKADECEGLEGELKVKEGIITLWEARCRRDETVMDTPNNSSTAPSKTEMNCKSQLEQLQSENEEMKSKYEQLEQQNNDLMQKAKMAEESGQLFVKRQKIERENMKQSVMNKQCSDQLEKLEADNEAMKSELRNWEGRYTLMEKLKNKLMEQNDELTDENEQLLEAVEAAANAEVSPAAAVQLKPILEVDEARVSELEAEYDSMKKMNDELVDKIGNLAEENGKLLRKCQQLEIRLAPKKHILSKTERESLTRSESLQPNFDELLNPFFKEARTKETKSKSTPITDMEREELLAVIEDVQAENDELHQSMKEAMQLTSSMNAKMKTFIQGHDESVKKYEQKLAGLKEELAKSTTSKEKLSMEVDTLKKEIRALKSEVKKANAARDSFQREMEEIDLDRECLREEKDEAYITCDVLQNEIDMLRRTIEESKEQENRTRGLNQATDRDGKDLCHKFICDDDISAKSDETRDYFKVSQQRGARKEGKNDIAKLTKLSEYISEKLESKSTNSLESGQSTHESTKGSPIQNTIAIDSSMIEQRGFYDCVGVLESTAMTRPRQSGAVL